MATVSLLLKKNKKTVNGEMPIYLRIIKDRKSKFLSLGIKIHPDLWDKNRQRAKKGHPNSNRLNNFLAHKVAEAEGIALELETRAKDVSSLTIRETVKGNTSPSFLKYFEEHLEDLKRNGKMGTHDKAISVLRKLKKSLKGKDLTFDEVNYQFLKRYEKYLRTELFNSTNTIYSNLKIFRKLLNDAAREEIIEPHRNPFPRFKLKWEKTAKAYLTEEELKQIEQLVLPKDQVIFHHRNMYVFACYAGGLRISDILQLQWKNFNGSHITIVIQKTNEQISIKLPNKALEILRIYRTENVRPTDFIFPCFKNEEDYSNAKKRFRAKTSNAAYANRNLKTIAGKAGVNKLLTFHTSRHTFATRALRKGMRIEYVSKILGHSTIKTTQIYAKIINADLDEAMDVFNE